MRTCSNVRAQWPPANRTWHKFWGRPGKKDGFATKMSIGSCGGAEPIIKSPHISCLISPFGQNFTDNASIEVLILSIILIVRFFNKSKLFILQVKFWQIALRTMKI